MAVSFISLGRQDQYFDDQSKLHHIIAMIHILRSSSWPIQYVILTSAIKFSTNILGDVQKNVPRVKQTIVTPSFVPIVNLYKGCGSGHKYSEKYWVSATDDDAANPQTPIEVCIESFFSKDSMRWDMRKKTSPASVFLPSGLLILHGPNAQIVKSLDNRKISSADI
ncbi:hypothetical protein BHYA_0030g00210 [Botrytis hyacinthi]|uniref:Uncharacterized protein n=1 Tax=Botrytis hyacinthi TaxID=278943 RepID=A0A4Z1GW76_9HELO|nr:hypothetical protein BHYA_0030g00210 [Botrytis hyacinthi]